MDATLCCIRISESFKLLGDGKTHFDVNFVSCRSFEGVCARLRKSFEDLKPMFTGIESSDTVLHAVVQQAVMGIQTTYSVRKTKKKLCF